MPQSVVDETIAKHVRRNMVLQKANPSTDNPSTGAPPSGPVISRPAKVNSGTVEEWKSITTMEHASHFFVDDFQTRSDSWVSQEEVDSGKEVIEHMGAPSNHKDRPLLNRDEIMNGLADVMGEPFDESSEFVLYKDSDDTYKSSDLAFAPEDYNVVLIKMWGFAGMRQTENPLRAYKSAVELIIAGSPSMKLKGAQQIMLDQKSQGLKTQFVLQFDGDAAFEKDDDGQSKKMMSHNVFAPFVAKIIKEIVPGAKVHLCITKLEGNTKKTPADLMKKFGDFMWKTYVGRGFDGGPLKLRTSTDSSPNRNTVPEHRYPYYDRRFFDSVTIQSKIQAYPTVGEKNGKPVLDYTSEHITQKMVEELYGDRIVFRVCLAFGGNTHNGVQAMKREIDAGKLSRWDIAWRHLVYATK